MGIDGCATKRHRLALCSVSKVSEECPRGYLTLARAKLTLTVQGTNPQISSLCTEAAAVSVSVQDFSAASGLRLTCGPGGLTASFILIDQQDHELRLIRNCIKLQPVAGYSHDDAALPLIGQVGVIIFQTKTNSFQKFTLDLAIVWKDDAQASASVDEATWKIWHTYVSTDDALQVPPQNPWDPRHFYENVHKPQPPTGDTTDLPISLLKCELYPFQKESVRWMLAREGVDINCRGQARARSTHDNVILANFRPTKDRDGRPCFVNLALGVMTSDLNDVQSRYQGVKGGILADEPGLGKTVELLALVCGHRRRNSPRVAIQPYSGLVSSPATLVICPPTILQQWMQNLQDHAPALQIYHYQGMNCRIPHCSFPGKTQTQFIEFLAECDVVVTTYAIIAQEFHRIDAIRLRDPVRKRHRDERPKSPLVQISWWRICLDEAHKVATGRSNAAKLAQQLSRVNAWAISGTPMRADHRDLYGLFLFLQHESWCVSLNVWDRLVESHLPLFRNFVGELAIRHSQELVRADTRLPPLIRRTVQICFSPAERQSYGEILNKMCADVEVDATGTPQKDNWDPTSPRVIASMQGWLDTLRSACLYPEVGGLPKRAHRCAVESRPPLVQILDNWLDHAVGRLCDRQEELIVARLCDGQRLQNGNDKKEAMKQYQAAYEESSEMVATCREDYDHALGDTKSKDKSSPQQKAIIQDSYCQNYGQRLFVSLRLQHACLVQLSCGNPQWKLDHNPADAASTRYHELSQREKEADQESKLIRNELLSDLRRKVDRFITYTKSHAPDNLVSVPEMSFEQSECDMESCNSFPRLQKFCDAMNAQAEQYRGLRQKLLELLLQPTDDIIDRAENRLEISSTHQEEGRVYMDILRVVWSDRSQAVTGKGTVLPNHTRDTLRQFAKDRGGPISCLILTLLKQRNQAHLPVVSNSLRGMVVWARDLVTTMQWKNDDDTSLEPELKIAQVYLQIVPQLMAIQVGALAALEEELDRFQETTYDRFEYEQAVREIYDAVPGFSDKPHHWTETRKDRSLTADCARKRYWQELRKGCLSLKEDEECPLCYEILKNRTITITLCGHLFCCKCTDLCQLFSSLAEPWWNCPVCKRRLRKTDCWDVPNSSGELTPNREASPHRKLLGEFSTPTTGDTISANFNSDTTAAVQHRKLPGSSFGSKVDNICHHLLLLRQRDPGCKTVIFTQFRPFLEILGRALTQLRIVWNGTKAKRGIEDFKDDPTIECLLVDDRVSASGLHLAVANHIFLCEPVVKSALEAQIISRVRRIGQKREVIVWTFFVVDTLEEEIYRLSRSRQVDCAQGETEKFTALQVNELGTTTTTSPLNGRIHATGSPEHDAGVGGADFTSKRSIGKFALWAHLSVWFPD